MRILITGGTGYLGQFLVKAFASEATVPNDVALTYSTKQPSAELFSLLGPCKAFKLDFATGEGMDQCIHDFGMPDVIINCAAISVPRECEKDPDTAFAVNVPKQLISRLRASEEGPSPLFIHLSTDQVYEGTKSMWTESDPTAPVNAYGRTKVAAEEEVRRWFPTSHVILRSSIIVGPSPPVPLAKGLPLQWMDQTLRASSESGQPNNFFNDEFRCPIFVLDLVRIATSIVDRASQGESFHHTFNAGGPDRLSRADMAAAVARHRGYPLTTICPQPASTAVGRGVASPPDISMDISRIKSHLSFTPTSYEEAVRQTLT